MYKIIEIIIIYLDIVEMIDLIVQICDKQHILRNKTMEHRNKLINHNKHRNKLINQGVGTNENYIELL